MKSKVKEYSFREILILAILVATCTQVLFSAFIYDMIESVEVNKKSQLEVLKEISKKMDSLTITVELEE